MGAHTVALPADSLSHKSSQIVAEISREDAEITPEYEPGALLDPPSDLDRVADFGNAITKLFLPPERELLRALSLPTEAVIAFGQTKVGQTELKMFVRRSAIDTLELSKEGYEACPFADGEYIRVSSKESTFSCRLNMQ
jgi:hypothetical protein